MKILNFIGFLSFAILLALIPVSCTEKESDVGSNMVDPATLYNGTCDTVALTGYTKFEDSLATMNYGFGLLGRDDNSEMGTTWASIYTQVALADNSGVNVAEGSVVVSAVLSLVVSDIYPTHKYGTHNAHIKVYQLADDMSDSAYYCFDSVAVNNQMKFCDTTISITDSTNLLELRMNSNIDNLVLTPAASADEFLQRMKGLRITMNEDVSEQPLMLTVQFSAVNTRLTVKCSKGSDTSSYSFVVGNKGTGSDVKHFIRFDHDYAGSSKLNLFATQSGRNDSIDGSLFMYLQPMGGTQVCLKLDPVWYSNFKANHPFAVVNYAELLLPVSNGDTNVLAKRLLAYKIDSNGGLSIASDASDGALYSGFDGFYTASLNAYRIRLTRHIQQLLQADADYGTMLMIDARRSSARSTKLNGYNHSKGTPSIRIVYSE